MMLLASMLVSARYSQPVSARTITVPDDFPTIQEAINNATNEDTVFVRSGTYYGKVVVNKTVSLIGEDMETTVILYNSSAVVPIVEVTASGAAVKNFSIVNNGSMFFSRGILVSDAYGCIISGNNLTERNHNGIVLNNASDGIITENVFIDNGLTVQQSYGNTILNNTLNGKPITYLEDVENEIVDAATAGEVILMHCYNVTVQHGNFSNAYTCVQLRESNSCRLVNNYFKDSWWGISLGQLSFNTVVTGNNLTNCLSSGISIFGNSNCSVVSENRISGSNNGISFSGNTTYSVVSENSISSNTNGINFGGNSMYSVVFENSISDNTKGINFGGNSSNDQIYHNNFVNNSDQVSPSSFITLDDGYPSGGNYWSDYNGTDLFKGAYQNVTGSDGIGDVPYSIDVDNKDNYPLMGPFGTSTTAGLNVTVFPTAGVSLTFDNVTAAGSTIAERVGSGPPPPLNFTSIGQYYEITVTAQYSDNITIRIIYDDSNMTQQEEDRLQLSQWLVEVCDVTGSVPGVPDGICNMRDIGYMCSHFGTTPSSLNWDPRCDVTGPTPNVPDGVVNMRDIGMATTHFGCQSQWINITLFVDTVNNLIFGETNHFSFIGIHR